MGGGGNGQCLDHSRQLTELGGDAVTLTGEEGDLGACILDDTACLRAQILALLPSVGDQRGSLGARTSLLVVGRALHPQDLVGNLLAERARTLLGLVEP